MSDKANVELARAVMSGRGDRDGFVGMLTDEVVIVPSLMLEERTVRGAAAVSHWLDALGASYEEYRAIGDDFEPGTSGRVLVTGSIVARPRGVEREHVRPAFWVITLEKARVAAIVSHSNEGSARQAAGL